MTEKNSLADPAWDLPEPYVVEVPVEAADIDELAHANNTAYLRWCELVAWRHSEAVGLGMAEYRTHERAMAAVRTVVRYLQPAFVNERLAVANWIVRADGRLRVSRRYQIVRPSDGATLARAQSDFVCIDLQNGTPRRLPPAFREAYAVRPAVAAALAAEPLDEL